MNDDEIRMSAYYYGFDKTGVPEIDLILSAVACAGKAFHHTDQWNDESSWRTDYHEGETPVEWIQNAAKKAAAQLAAVQARADHAETKLAERSADDEIYTQEMMDAIINDFKRQLAAAHQEAIDRLRLVTEINGQLAAREKELAEARAKHIRISVKKNAALSTAQAALAPVLAVHHLLLPMAGNPQIVPRNDRDAANTMWRAIKQAAEIMEGK
jgi:hypothetical protein